MFEKHNDSYFQFYTNSTLLTEEKVNKLAELGNAIPILSIEGYFDKTKLERVLYNLLINAFKYTSPNGSVFLRLQLA